MLASCIATPPPFDEDAWRREVEDRRMETLYAPHFRDGAYFNPWMPMEADRLRSFLKWRFTRKAAYTDEEQRFLPKVLTGSHRAYSEKSHAATPLPGSDTPRFSYIPQVLPG